MPELVTIDTAAPTPQMIQPAAAAFERLRRIVAEHSGIDFLAKCGDVLRPADFRSTKDGVDNRSWHKTGRAFDYDQEQKALIIQSEPIGGRQYFRTFLKCGDQSGRQGIKRHVKDIRGHTVDAYVFDFTAAAEVQKFERIPAWNGWQTHYNRREFWHSVYNPEDLTWDAAMLQLKGKQRPPAETVVGLNDRGPLVREIQIKLSNAGLLPMNEIDGVFGRNTRLAVTAFQLKHSLDNDGIVGPATRKALAI